MIAHDASVDVLSVARAFRFLWFLDAVLERRFPDDVIDVVLNWKEELTQRVPR